MIFNLCLADEEIMRSNAMFKGMVVNNFGPTSFIDEARSHLARNNVFERF